ncbi:lccl domain containing protein [Sporothrix brasiliensis 5110]|uniref:Lccl domain containing protein n=1 Tax=Sporothrix brasiliensis 5110 TaxID=1398154 RepID=A0A0C2IIV2_9PEZI|nr:lccl domain containing protein [Sporothrix brasiliensis 5110]KIH86925.1 lccl domain containing protein [Sporothrix brasiliensis 5110]
MGEDNDVNKGLLDGDIRRSARSEGSSSSDTIAAEVGFERPDERLDGDLSELEEDADASDDAPPTPRFMQDEGSWRRFRWVPYWVRRSAKAAVQWSRGPEDARPFVIEPLLPVVQHAPLQLLDWLLDRLPGSKDDPLKSRIRWRRALLGGWLAIWLLTFALVMRRGIVAGEMADWGIPGDIGCGNTYWVPGNMCGLDGSGCRPFNGSGFAFRCPATCAGYQVLNPRAVGDKEVVYQTLVVGGPNSGANGTDHIYRGDSFICSAAIHAGVINNAAGGCGVVRLVGRQTHFTASNNNGIQSIAFDSYFPLAFTFEQGVSCPGQQDARWPLLAVSVVFSTILSLFVTSPAAFFFSVFTGLFWHVGLASDPPPHASIPALLSNISGKFLPAALVAWVIFDVMAVRRTLTGLTAQIEKTVLWLGGCWAGSLNNYTFDGIPIQRLTPHDLAQQPGAKAALAIIIGVLLSIAATQVWYFRREGRLRRYLQLYILFISGLVVCMLLPGLRLRIHHYIVGLLLLPGTSMQTRPALVYQGILVGLFINGIARWGWDSLLQTAAALQDDAQLNSPLPTLLEPVVRLANTTVATAVEAAVDAATGLLASDVSRLAGVLTAAANTSSITFSWQPPPGPRYDGISVLVNDVERYRGYFDDPVEADGTSNGGPTFTWERPADVAAAGVDEYFRFGYMEGSQTDDYTRAGIWTAEGEWLSMPPGPSRVRSREVAEMR